MNCHFPSLPVPLPVSAFILLHGLWQFQLFACFPHNSTIYFHGTDKKKIISYNQSSFQDDFPSASKYIFIDKSNQAGDPSRKNSALARARVKFLESSDFSVVGIMMMMFEKCFFPSSTKHFFRTFQIHNFVVCQSQSDKKNVSLDVFLYSRLLRDKLRGRNLGFAFMHAAGGGKSSLLPHQRLGWA